MSEFKLNNLRELSTEEQFSLQGGWKGNPCLEAECGCSCTCECSDRAPDYSYKRESAQLALNMINQRKVTEAMNRW